MANDLERKMETALAARLKQHQPLSKVRMRYTSEDSAKVNQDIVISAKRGEQNPPFSGIFNMDVSVTLSMKHRKTLDTLPTFLGLCGSLEEVLCGVDNRTLAAQLSLCVPDFHCYEVTVNGKDDEPVDEKHSCIWTLSAVVMPQSYLNSAALQNQSPPI